jgi:uncharacterized caspase-like protein
MTHRFAAAGVFLSSLLIFLVGLSDSLFAQNRIALVVGNSTYSNVPALPNPANDAADVSQSLQRLGFSVTTLPDAKFDALRRALIDFGRAARGADMAVLFFAGHGVEIGGENWLLPVDVELKNDIDVNTEAVGLRAAMQAVSNAKRLGLVILDACRNNPFAGKTRGIRPTPTLDPGLAPIEPGENVLVAYAARDGTTASDGAGRNSPYTTALLKHLETPGLEIEFLFRNVRDDVMSATKDEQQPFVYGSLSHEGIYLKDGPPVQVAYNATAVASDAGEIAWSFLKGTSDADTLHRFIEQFPSSNRVSDVKVRLASLASTPTAPTADAQPAAQTYLASAELDTLTRQTARPYLKNTPAVETAWKLVRRANDAAVIRRFADQFPSRERQVAANQRLTELGEPTIPRALLLRAADDADVIQCSQANDVAAPECQRAIEKFPDIWTFLSDYRFRIKLCEALEKRGHCNEVITDAWSRPLFRLWHQHGHGHEHGGNGGSHNGHQPGPHKSAKADRTKSSRHSGSNRTTQHHEAHQNKDARKTDARNHDHNNGPNKTASNSGSSPNTHSGGGGGHHR